MERFSISQNRTEEKQIFHGKCYKIPSSYYIQREKSMLTSIFTTCHFHYGKNDESVFYCNFSIQHI